MNVYELLKAKGVRDAKSRDIAALCTLATLRKMKLTVDEASDHTCERLHNGLVADVVGGVHRLQRKYEDLSVIVTDTTVEITLTHPKQDNDMKDDKRQPTSAEMKKFKHRQARIRHLRGRIRDVGRSGLTSAERDEFDRLQND